MDRDAIYLIEQQIDAWLRAWHAWASSDRVGRGYPSMAAGCGMYRASRQYDTDNGALDLEADIAEAEAVESVIATMASMHRQALAINARNLAGPRVWRSPKMDADKLAELTAEGRGILWAGMHRKGLA